MASNRRLATGEPKAGRWRNELTPYLIPVWEAWENPAYTTLVLMTASQMAKTEFILGCIGKRFAVGPRKRTLYVGPTEKHCRKVSEDRVKPMISSTPALYRLLDPKRNKTTEKYLANVLLGFGWAGSSTEMASTPYCEVHVDERDRMERDCQGEGAPDLVAAARTKNYRGGKVGIYSTPTLWGLSAILAWWRRGTRFIWSLRCGDCESIFPPTLETLSYDATKTPAQIRRSAVIACPACGGITRNAQRQDRTYGFASYDMDDSGKLTLREAPPDTTIASFWVTGMMSLFIKIGDLAEALATARETSVPEDEQAIVNTQFGEAYRVRGDSPEYTAVLEHAGEYKRGEMPNFVQRLVLGVDVQGDRLPWTLRGFGPELKSALVQYGELMGDTDRRYVWTSLEELVASTWNGLTIDVCLIDSGYRPGLKRARPEHAVYAFCRKVLNAFPTKGRNTLEKPIRKTDISYDRGRFVLKQPLYLVNTHYWKQWIYARLRRELTEPGAWLVPSDTTEGYAKGVVSESLVPGSNPTWVVTHPENHPLDCEVLCAAGAELRNYAELLTDKEAAPTRRKRKIKRDPSMTRRGI